MVSVRDFRNLHEGKRVFLMASGPTLSHLDLTPLSRRLVIGMNRSSLLFPNTHYHCTMDLPRWSPPLQTALPNPLSGLSAFTTKNRVTLVYNHTEQHQRYPLSLSQSSDEGITWADPWHIEVLPIEVSYPSFLADDNGSVGSERY